ncbi:MAG: hypothetical protein GX282_00235 [Campylobacteraceae bacterium]|nr:hypothetical protein [Campylobacteraceae bacterium]
MKKVILLCILLASLNAEWFYKGEPNVGSYILATNDSGEEKPVKIISINNSNATCVDKNGNKIDVRILENDKKLIVIHTPSKSEPKPKETTQQETITKPKIEEKITKKQETPNTEIAQTKLKTIKQERSVIVKKYYIYEPERYPREYYRQNFRVNNNGLSFEINYGWDNGNFESDYREARRYKPRRIPRDYHEPVRTYSDLLNLKKPQEPRRPNHKREEYREPTKIIQRDNASKVLGDTLLSSEPSYAIKGGNLGEIKDGF